MPHKESEIRREALNELRFARNGFLTTTQLISSLEKRMKPTGQDAEILEGRSDTKFSQKVRNLVSHRQQSTGLEAQGLAVYDPIKEGWRITELGRGKPIAA